MEKSNVRPTVLGRWSKRRKTELADATANNPYSRPKRGQSSVVASISQLVLDFITRYGYVAVFVYMLLETAFILHFAPSELVVPFAASQLVHGPVTFVLFVLDATAGATAGAVLVYYVFARYGESAIRRYGRYIHVSGSDLDRSQRWFVRWGEGSVFWGRLLPFVRALISMPAGLAEMNARKFVLYSAAGSAVFNTALTFLTYSGAGHASPLGLVGSFLGRTFREQLTYLVTRRAFVAIVVIIVAVTVAFVWWQRDWIRRYPETSIIVGLHLARAFGILLGVLFLIGAVSSPGRAFAAVTWVWDDPLVFVQLGFTQQVALILTGVAFVGGGLVAFELRKAVRSVQVQALLE